MNFSEALEAIKAGKRLCRSGWNGRGMFVFLVSGSNFVVNREPLLSILGPGEEVTYQPHLDMRTADGSISVWHPSATDLVADDWEVVDPRTFGFDDDGRPFSADDAIVKAIDIYDHFDRLAFLKAWSEGDWNECQILLGEDGVR